MLNNRLLHNEDNTQYTGTGMTQAIAWDNHYHDTPVSKSIVSKSRM